ncbi:single-stranded DNA-binding protein [Georgenia sp. TF02-10]|uniref:single-stranded DNA-binding protein n=1 Tax=Georgenia sp. TF02-10 TaxID=2917725 RepID=UPI001FA7AD64|nr:single-stranded DNA-binding protein [Georgenia sp. TF02-10]UNX54027.1 single-stranded DNA-binding protein [Georgenia sp. TF02-10]
MSSDKVEIIVHGNVGGSPTFYTAKDGGKEWCHFRVGATPRYLNRATGEWQNGDTQWFTVKAWGELAISAKCLAKGMPVVVRGRVRVETWTGESGERWDHVVHASSLAVELSPRGEVNWVRLVRESADGARAAAGAGRGGGTGTDRGPGGGDGAGPAAVVLGPDGSRWEGTELPDVPTAEEDYPEDVDGEDTAYVLEQPDGAPREAAPVGG